ncbi:Hsp33 family molecular chaperone HslO [Alcanivorax sp. JB21]|uniref:Hsp33 family molecular chaperone HslO n=1 Tax=Alcanivorax limicola TaxID=2874102 RepID=UPI001CBD6067|nr:Hsp33 family molecular chaperone HslO [Alcanivorax limicola]MBZ2189210.1 Hsp33 family molecular chaperone HslO [Alcanivorax limicola]
MSTTDLRQRFLFPDSDIRGEIVRLDTSVAQALQARSYPLVIEALLGEAMAAATLLSGTLKFEGRLSLQAQGQGDLTLLLAECTHDSQIRGLARTRLTAGDSEQQPMTAQLPALLGDGIMAITIVPERGNQYQGLVPMESDTLAGCLEGYFSQSEQLPTRLWLAAGNGHAAGLLIQVLPEHAGSAEHNARVWETVTALAGTLTMEELLTLPVETVLHRLFHEAPPILSPADTVRFGCTCSREKVRGTLLSLGSEELQALLSEQGEARVTCDFCGSEELFDAVDLAELAHQSAS